LLFGLVQGSGGVRRGEQQPRRQGTRGGVRTL